MIILALILGKKKFEKKIKPLRLSLLFCKQKVAAFLK
jgi:hypothetical protein